MYSKEGGKNDTYYYFLNDLYDKLITILVFFRNTMECQIWSNFFDEMK